jgi:cytochrome bd-type quinol oxidase subunit 1
MTALARWQFAITTILIDSILVGMAGLTQTQYMVQAQPMKMAAAEALWETAGHEHHCPRFCAHRAGLPGLDLPYLSPTPGA